MSEATSHAPGEIIFELPDLLGRPTVVWKRRQPPMDYWAAVRNDLDLLRAPIETGRINISQCFNAIAKIVWYIAIVHQNHKTATEALRSSRAQSRPIVLYLRNFFNSGAVNETLGRKRWIIDEDGQMLSKDQAAGFRLQRSVGGDYSFVPIIQEQFPEAHLIYLQTTDMYTGSSHEGIMRLAGTCGFRAHGHNWQQLVGDLVAAARCIVLYGEQSVASVQTEIDLISRYGRWADTTIIVRHEHTSIDAHRFHELGDSLDVEDFVEKNTFSWQELQEMRAKGGSGLWLPNISHQGREFLRGKFRSGAAIASLPEAWERYPCYINGRDWTGKLTQVNGDKAGCFIQDHQLELMDDWADGLQKMTTANEEAVQIIREGVGEDRDRLLQISKRAFVSGLKVFAASCEIENYVVASNALSIVIQRYQSVIRQRSMLAQLVELLSQFELTLGIQVNSAAIYAAMREE